ncbi:MAG TPA: ParB N-terminal domain-containing protein [Bryobacteraceae bacterium]|nr:ParB N-terminal domain-containing protein [Bryobacteraceae bacterium]
MNAEPPIILSPETVIEGTDDRPHEDEHPEQPAAAVACGSADQPEYGMSVHPVCDLFPFMPAGTLDKLAEDIRANGQVKPIVVHEGQIVDGRNRLLACRKAGVEPQCVEWRETYHGPMTLARWIWSVNAERRHMTVDQIVAAHILVRGWEEREAARQRKAEGQKQGGETAGNGRPKADSFPMNSSGSYSEPGAAAATLAAAPQEKPQAPDLGDTRAKLAKEIGVSQHKVQQAMNVHKVDPAALNEVARGTIRLREAEKRVRANRHNRVKSKVTKAMTAPRSGRRTRRRCLMWSKPLRPPWALSTPCLKTYPTASVLGSSTS